MNQRSLLWVLCLIVIASFGSAAEIIRIKPRIIDGTNVPDSQFPTVGIISDSANSFICTGTLIAPHFVLTAAHCSVNGTTGMIDIGQTGGRFKLGGKTYRTAHVYAHPSYKGDDSQEVEGAIDLSIFELTEDVPNVTPSPLYRQTPSVGTVLTLVGFGEQGTGQKGSDGTLPKNGTVNFGVTPISIVTSTFIKWNFQNVPAPNQQSNTAPGDSGGPQFITNDGTLFLASVTSGGKLSNAAFGDQSYNTRVDIAADWIDSITGGSAVAGNHPPVIGSTSFSPNTIAANQQVTFTAPATDSDNDTLNYHWVFGDGTENVTGKSTELHTYTVDGAYTVQVIVTDGKGGSAGKDFNITVGIGSTGAFIPSTLSQSRFTLNFAAPTHSSLDFTLTNGGLSFADKNAYMNVFDGGQAKIYLGAQLVDTISISGTKGKGLGTLIFTYRTGAVHYSVHNDGELIKLLAPFGASNANITSAFIVPIRVELNGKRYGSDTAFSYSAKFGKTGSGK